MVKKIKISNEKFNAFTEDIKANFPTEDGYVYRINSQSGYIVQSFLITYNAPNGDIYAFSPDYKKAFEEEA